MNNLLGLAAPEVQDYITESVSAASGSKNIIKSPFPDVTAAELITQISGRKIAAKKIPAFSKSGILFPAAISMEQCSSQATAEYKASLFSGENLLDLTAGLGVDAYFLSRKFAYTQLVEQNPALCDLINHNWQALQQTNFSVFNGQAEDFLENNTKPFDLVYIDPARRNVQEKKVFLLEDLTPNILVLLPKILTVTPQVLIKLSPLFDITQLLRELPCVSQVHLVALRNEVKELLVIVCEEKHHSPTVHCVNLDTEEPTVIAAREDIAIPYGEVRRYLYIPNNALIKAALYGKLCQDYGLIKLHPNTHFLTSDERMENFPGRVLEVEKISSKEIKKNMQYNIISKNHPLRPEDIKNKYKLRDGGDHYLIFTSDTGGKLIMRSI